MKYFHARFSQNPLWRGVLPGELKITPERERETMYHHHLSVNHFRYLGTLVKNVPFNNKRELDVNALLFLNNQVEALLDEYDMPKLNPEAAFISLAKYGKSQPPWTPDTLCKLRMATDWAIRHFQPHMGMSKLLEHAEAVQLFNLDSGGGYPFSDLGSSKGEILYNHNWLLDWLEDDYEKLKSGKPWRCVFVNAEKEEVRLKSKIQKNSLRTFLAGGMDATYAGTRLFSDMNTKMLNSKGRTWSQVGMSPMNGEWDRLMRRMDCFKNGYSLDGEQYDSSLNQLLMWTVAYIRFHMLAPELQTEQNKKMIQTYYLNLIHTIILLHDGTLVTKTTGNPSGSVNTITDNTIIAYILLAFSWIDLCPLAFRTFEQMHANVKASLVGDDNFWTVSEAAHRFMNGIGVRTSWKKLGVTATSESWEPRRALDMDFLSATTGKLHGMYVPVYNQKKLLASWLYIPRKDNHAAGTMRRLGAYLLLAHTNPAMYSFLRSFSQWMIARYSNVNTGDPEWDQALTTFLTPNEMDRIFTSLLPHEHAMQTMRDSLQIATPQSICKTTMDTLELLQLVAMRALARIGEKVNAVVLPKKKKSRYRDLDESSDSEASSYELLDDMEVLSPQGRNISKDAHACNCEMSKTVSTTTTRTKTANPRGTKQQRKRQRKKAAPPPKTMVVRTVKPVGSKKVNLWESMTPEAKAFLVNALDPMHDSATKLVGWPDRNIELSVVRKIPQSVPVAFPADNPTFPDTLPSWDCHVVLWPWLQQLPCANYARTGNALVAAELEAFNVGGVSIYATAPGANLIIGPENFPGSPCPLLGTLNLPTTVTVGTGRIVGIGIEIINKTAPLYRSGDIYTWRSPEPALTPSTWYYQTNFTVPGPVAKTATDLVVASWPATAQVVRHPPKNSAEALLYKGTRVDKAEHGAYMVGTFTDFNNPAKMVDYTLPVIINNEALEDTTYDPLASDPTATINTSTVITAVTQAKNGISGYPGVKLYPINGAGAILTGLTQQTVLTVRLNVIYESFPSVAQLEILELANPSARYNQQALELLANVMRKLPTSVPSSANASGDWWRMILKGLSIIAPAALAGMGVPEMIPLVEAGVAAVTRR